MREREVPPTKTVPIELLLEERELQRDFSIFVRKRRVLENNQRIFLFVLQRMLNLILSLFF